MKIVRWSPLEEMNLIRRQLDDMFSPITANTADGTVLSYTPPVEVTETPEHYFMRVMVPGINPEDIQLQATQKSVTISGEISPRQLDKDETVHLNEFRSYYGKFSKQMSFPEAIEHEKVDASYNAGILEVTLPKAVDSHRKTIEIKIKNN